MTRTGIENPPASYLDLATRVVGEVGSHRKARPFQWNVRNSLPRIAYLHSRAYAIPAAWKKRKGIVWSGVSFPASSNAIAVGQLGLKRQVDGFVSRNLF